MSSSNRFANVALKQAQGYERKFRKRVPYSEIIDVLRRQAAFDAPLKFVLDRDSESAGFFKRNPQWDFDKAGVRFEAKADDNGIVTLVVTWSDDFVQAPLQTVLDELNDLGIHAESSVSIELVSPKGERKASRFGNGLSVDRDGTTVHFTGAWS